MLFIANSSNFTVKTLHHYHDSVSKLHVIKITELKLHHDDDADDKGKWMNE